MKTLSNNDIWILRTLIKLNDYIKAEHQNFYDEFIALRTHINQMTYRNKSTNLRDVYTLLRKIAIEYKSGAEQFAEYYNKQKVNKRVDKLMQVYAAEIVEVTK